MARKIINNVKLGAFVIGGLLFLVVLLYMIGKDSNLFGDTYRLKARFENVQGLLQGNNVRFSGIQVGTVKRITIVNDTVIEVTMVIQKKMQSVIRKNAIASIGTEGLVGNKVVNIVPDRSPAGLAVEGDILVSRKLMNTEDMLQTLNQTNNDIAVIAAELKSTIRRFNNSYALWSLLDDRSLPLNLRTSVSNIRSATVKAEDMFEQLDEIVANVRKGQGSLGILLKDTSFAENLNGAARKIRAAANEADSLAAELNRLAVGVNRDIQEGPGIINALLRDTTIVRKINNSLDNIQKGTDGFNQNMEALKHNFLLRGYFRKQERKNKSAVN